MKVSQIVVESRKQTTNEAPVGKIKQGLTKFGAKAAAKLGAKDTALGLAVKADTGDEANKLRGEFQNYMGSTGQAMKNIETGELIAWLKSKKFPTDKVQPQTGQINKKQLDKILLQVVQDNKRVSGGAGATAQPAAGAGANAKQSTTNTGAVNKGTATGSSTAPDGKAPPTQNGSAGGPATGIPPNIQAQLDLLNDPDKKRLAALL
jgi:hypothetical protein